MLKALLVSIALLATPIPLATYAFTGIASPGASAADPGAHPERLSVVPPPRVSSKVEIDASALPGPTGWFVVPVTADRETYVDVQAKAKDAYDASGAVKGFGIIVAMPDASAPSFFTSIQNGYRTFAVNHEGNLAACCQTPQEVSWWNGGYARTGAGNGGAIGPDRPLYVGLAAVGWAKDSKLKITVEAYDATLHVGQPITGERAQAIDLVQAAYERGTNVQIGTSTLAGKPGAFDLTWKTEHAGLIGLNYYMQNRGQGKLSLALPDGRVIDNGEGVDVAGHVMGAAGAGQVRISFTEVNAPDYLFYTPLTHNANEEPGWVHAVALLADVKIPQRGVDAMRHDVQTEDDW